jgi:hypothetical protein
MATTSADLVSNVPPTRYDAFISYSHRDRGWVDAYLLPPLEQAGLRVCVDYRDFEVGVLPQENMENAVRESRHVIQVLSTSYVKSEWAGFEGILASAEDPIGRRRKLVPLLIETTDLPLRFQTRTYADFCDFSNYDAEMKRVIRAVKDDPDTYSKRDAAVAGEPIAKGLEAVRKLTTTEPMIKAAAVQFRTIFGTVCEQLKDVADYKCLHDQLHELELHCYQPMTKVAAQFPADEDAKEELDGYWINFENVVDQLHAIAQRFVRADTSWIPNVENILADFRKSLDSDDAALLSHVIKRLDRELGNRPPKINARLNAAARALRLSELVAALAQIRDLAAEVSGDLKRLRDVHSGVETLDSMEKQMTRLVSLHDQWQNLDEYLRCMEKNPDIEDLRSCWPDVKGRADEIFKKCPEMGGLVADTAKLEQTLQDGDSAQAMRKVRLLRRQVITKFFNTDTDLKNQCDELRSIGEPLAALLKVIQ